MSHPWTPGIFESVFPRSGLVEQFLAVREAGFCALQFDLMSAGVDPWQREVERSDLETIRHGIADAGIRIPALAGTYNMAHPDPTIRAEGHQGLARVIHAASQLGAEFVTLCTGTRNTESMWRTHPDNQTSLAWNDAQDSIMSALTVAEATGITLLIEPEPANVVGSASLARQMLDEVNSPALKIVLDPANIVLSDMSRNPAILLDHAFDTLGPDIVFAHAKDLTARGEFCAAGTGIVPWAHYWSWLQAMEYSGDVIFHTLTEEDVPRALATFDLTPEASSG